MPAWKRDTTPEQQPPFKCRRLLLRTLLRTLHESHLEPSSPNTFPEQLHASWRIQIPVRAAYLVTPNETRHQERTISYYSCLHFASVVGFYRSKVFLLRASSIDKVPDDSTGNLQSTNERKFRCRFASAKINFQEAFDRARPSEGWNNRATSSQMTGIPF
ncbi:hypothetical protein BDN70DRAFT_876520 [Pholiota conissans]|uniref:Uncharacterized protein n=1 Tax=Pholiota conissans TaxID=109636 RepID=A0A9P6CW11_9AGAR|nr:hypothetical protein BDN70DRAFT_876520 [Pholiota conissans]